MVLKNCTKIDKGTTSIPKWNPNGSNTQSDQGNIENTWKTNCCNTCWRFEMIQVSVAEIYKEQATKDSCKKRARLMQGGNRNVEELVDSLN